MSWALAAAALVIAYLIGSIPTAYLLVRWLKGVDIRSVGSGNVGATNAARVLGVRFFPVVFVIDLLKGYLPTAFLPIAVARLSSAHMPSLPVLIAVAAIVGHNFPAFLGFRGGKGVATSVGAVAALDGFACLMTVLAFATFLLVTRIVSLSSILAALVFVFVHFYRVANPWSTNDWPMSAATIGLLILLIVRHRSNIVRIARGTEPRIRIGRNRRGQGASGHDS